MDAPSGTDAAGGGDVTSAAVISTSQLTRAFGRHVAVDGVDLHVRAGRVYGLLGPNGAGKSTTLRMLLGLLAPTSGDISLFGAPWHRAALHRVGASIDGPSLYGHLSARGNVRVHSRLLGLGDDAVSRALSCAGLEGTGRAKARSSARG